MPIKNLPSELQPREKAHLHGISSLSDIELLALFIRNGREKLNVMQISQIIFNKFNSFKQLSNSTFAELRSIKGIGQVKSLELHAIFEMAKRINNEKVKVINNDKDAFKLGVSKILDKKQEHFFIVVLNNNNEVEYQKILYTGAENSINLSGRQILSEVLKREGRKFYCFHNHPSGIAIASDEDKHMTESIKYYCKMLGINFMGHIIIASNKKYLVLK